MSEPLEPKREVIVTFGDDDSVGKKMLRDFYARRDNKDPRARNCPCEVECGCRFRS